MEIKNRIEKIIELVQALELTRYEIASNINELKYELKDEVAKLCETKIEFKNSNISSRIIVAIENEIERLNQGVDNLRNLNIGVYQQVKWTSDKVINVLEDLK